MHTRIELLRSFLFSRGSGRSVPDPGPSPRRGFGPAVALGVFAVLAGPLTTGLVPEPAAREDQAAEASSWIEGDLPRQGDRPLEKIPGLDSVYGVFEASDGTRLRTVLTRPQGSEGPMPAIVFIQWLSCDSIELPAGRQDGWSRMLRQVATGSGRVMLRTEKAGVGDSEGPSCSELGYEQELAHHRDALAWLLEHSWVDPQRVVIFGASMGATMAPLVAADHEVEGVVAWGGGAKTWLERTLGFERRYREGVAMAPDRLTDEMKAIAQFLPEYLVERRAPRDMAVADPQLAETWELLVGTQSWTHYGRPPIFHQQAQAQDWASAWAELEAPALILYGEYDWYEDEAGHRLIVDLVNRSAPGLAQLAIVPAIDHHFERYPSWEAAVRGEGGEVAEGQVVEEILAWLKALNHDRR